MYKIHNPSVYALYTKKVIDSCERKDHLNTCMCWILKNKLISVSDCTFLCGLIDKKLYNKKECKMKTELIQHLRNENGHPIATVVGRKDENGDVYFGYSKCNTKYDTFSKKRGIQIARGRSEKGFDMERMPFFVRERYPLFYRRCVKYFKK